MTCWPTAAIIIYLAVVTVFGVIAFQADEDVLGGAVAGWILGAIVIYIWNDLRFGC